MISIRETKEFSTWLDKLRDDRAKARIANRIARPAGGNPGDIKPIGEGLSELRIDYGPGYRVYLTRKGSVLIILLCGGDKRTQDTDIRKAKELARQYEET